MNDTPTLTGDSIYAEIGINRPEGTIECHLTQSSDTRKDCEEIICTARVWDIRAMHTMRNTHTHD